MIGNLLLPALVLFPILSSFFCYYAGRRSKSLRNQLAIWITFMVFAGSVAGLVFVIQKQTLSFSLPGICGLGISFRLDGFRGIYSLLTSFLWLGAAIFSRDYFAHSRNRNRYYFFFLMTLGATQGVFLSADLYTTFIFFEIMSFTSYAMVAHDESRPALRAAGTYLAVAIFGGMSMLMGLFLLWHHAGTLEIALLYESCQGVERAVLYAASILLLIGFGAKAGMFPLHIWLPKAHPAAPAPASALLSGILTKTGIFGVLVVSCEILRQEFAWGLALLILGEITMLLGAVLAVFSVDLKRTLACSSVSQIGFIVTGMGMQALLGEHNALAVRGTLLHMINHSLIKMVLFMAAGVIYLNLHRLQLDDIRGFGRGKPLLLFVFLMGAFSLAGVPLFSGYISKTLLHESIVEYIGMFSAYTPFVRLMQGMEGVFLFSGGLTVAYMTKLFVTIFVEKNPQQEQMDALNKGYISKSAARMLVIPAALLPILGAAPILMDKIADLGQGFMHGHSPEHPVHYFIWDNLKGALISLTIGALVYLLVIRKLLAKQTEDGICYPDRWPGWLDLEDSLYRPLLGGLIWLGSFVMQGFDRIIDFLVITLLPTMGTFWARVLETITDGIVRWILRRPLRQSKAKKPFGSFLGQYYWLIFPRHEAREPQALSESFSYSLLLFGIGLCVMLVYVLVAALRYLL